MDICNICTRSFSFQLAKSLHLEGNKSDNTSEDFSLARKLVIHIRSDYILVPFSIPFFLMLLFIYISSIPLYVTIIAISLSLYCFRWLQVFRFFL